MTIGIIFLKKNRGPTEIQSRKECRRKKCQRTEKWLENAGIRRREMELG